MKAVIFDLDGTLIPFYKNADKIWFSLIKDFFKEFNLNLSFDVFFDKFKENTNKFWSDKKNHRKNRLDLIKSRKLIIEKTLKRYSIFSKKKLNYLSDNYFKRYINSLYLFDGVKELLKDLKKDYKLFLLTNGASFYQREKLKKLDLEQYFDDIFIEGEMGFGKPDLKTYELIMEKYKLSSEDLMMIGDNLEWDVLAPKKLGIKAIFISKQGEIKELKNKIIIYEP